MNRPFRPVVLYPWEPDHLHYSKWKGAGLTDGEKGGALDPILSHFNMTISIDMDYAFKPLLDSAFLACVWEEKARDFALENFKLFFS